MSENLANQMAQKAAAARLSLGQNKDRFVEEAYSGALTAIRGAAEAGLDVIDVGLSTIMMDSQWVTVLRTKENADVDPYVLNGLMAKLEADGFKVTRMDHPGSVGRIMVQW